MAAGNGRGRADAFKAAGIPEEAQKALTGAFDALSGWRDEIASAAERNSSAVFDKMGTAAKAMGWPSELVDMTRQQMQQGSKLQLQMMDQVMDIWEQQIKAPGSPMPGMPGMGAMPGMPGMPKFENPFANMPGMAGMMGPGGIPGMPDFSGMANPMQFWMQAAEMWQKNWATAMQSAMEMQKSAFDKAGKGPFG
ncbi:MAG: hypothetical protein ABL894_11340 [Hyphomicrobium sp.]